MFNEVFNKMYVRIQQLCFVKLENTVVGATQSLHKEEYGNNIKFLKVNFEHQLPNIRFDT